MQLQIPEELVDMYGLDEGFYYIDKIKRDGIIISNSKINKQIELTIYDVNKIIEYNNEFLKNKIYKIEKSFCLYK